MARQQLGTVGGGGNHYVDIFEDEAGWLWTRVQAPGGPFGAESRLQPSQCRFRGRRRSACPLPLPRSRARPHRPSSALASCEAYMDSHLCGKRVLVAGGSKEKLLT